MKKNKVIKSKADASLTGLIVVTAIVFMIMLSTEIFLLSMARMRAASEITKVQEVISYAGYDGSWGVLPRVSTYGCESVPAGLAFTSCLKTNLSLKLNSIDPNMKATVGAGTEVVFVYSPVFPGNLIPDVTWQEKIKQ